jgi:pyruvate ferredoxin oxidoreductase delta subunit
MSEKKITDAKRCWQELPLGGVIEKAGNSIEYKTGTWRTWKPLLQLEHCTHCLLCWVYCPEEALVLRDGEYKSGKTRKEIAEIDYDYCKGCGLCIRECPVNRMGKSAAILFEREAK